MISPAEAISYRSDQNFLYTFEFINNPPTCKHNTQSESVIFACKEIDFASCFEENELCEMIKGGGLMIGPTEPKFPK